MQAKEREWRASVEASIELKDARSRMIQREREAAKKQVSTRLCHARTHAHALTHSLTGGRWLW